MGRDPWGGGDLAIQGTWSHPFLAFVSDVECSRMIAYVRFISIWLMNDGFFFLELCNEWHVARVAHGVSLGRLLKRPTMVGVVLLTFGLSFRSL